MQLRCIVNAGIMLGEKIDQAPDLLTPKELEVYKHYFFDITGWTHLDWNDYKKEVAPYEKKALQYALEGKMRDLQLALQIVPSSTEDEQLRDMGNIAYKQYMRIAAKIGDDTPANQPDGLLKQVKLWADIASNMHKARMAGLGTVVNGNSSSENADQGRLPPFRLIYIDQNGNIAVRKTREELEADMKKKLEEDELRYKALEAQSSGGRNADRANGAKKP